MAEPQTLHSRLRVLVARTFRAEKLYGSVKNLRELKALNSPEFSSDLANEMRGQEWQRSHAHLRTSLNEILALGNASEMLKQLTKLRNIFYSHYQNAEVLLQRSAAELEESTNRQEYAHAMRLAIELVRQKARSQSCRLITEELGAILVASGKGEQPSSEENLPLLPLDKVVFGKIKKESSDEHIPSNVIPLKRRIAR